jgi:spermidine/putrescine transport system substrate-binding protein
MKYLIVLFSLFSGFNSYATSLNVYVWGSEIPKQLIQKFEEQTQIHVNFSTYDSNETMLAKIRANQNGIYDIILPSAYYVDRMRHLKLLTRLDHTQLPNLKYLSETFQNNQYDPHNHYSVPLTWGATGIFYNQQYIKIPPRSWRDLWKARWKESLMLLDDMRDTFAIAMFASHYMPNDTDPHHLAKAFQMLLKLSPNIKFFASEGIQTILIDGDATIGSAWNGDVYKARQENPNIQFVYPEEGYVLWIDCLAIPSNAPHLKEAYTFINFLLAPENAAIIAKIEGHAITNQQGKALLPPQIRNDKTIYPSDSTLKRAIIQKDAGEKTLPLYNHYWQTFKLSLF